MDARLGGESHHLYAAGASSLNGIAKKGFEWDLNDWRWDGEHFVASRLGASPANCRNKQVLHDLGTGLHSNNSSSSSEETNIGLLDKEKGTEKRRRIVVVEEEEQHDENGHLSLELGGHVYPAKEAEFANGEEKNGKKSKPQGGNSNRPTCQVEGCGADLSGAKDYHKRHKVCEMHAKASTAVVGNSIQRFCQQCSRFHLLQEFDEGKRSCRRRLAGHNRRRRKTHPEVPVSGNLSSDEQASSFLLISLLRILSNLQADNSERSKDQELLTNFLNNIAKLAGSVDPTNLSRLIQTSQDQQKLVSTAGTSSEAIHASSENVVPLSESARPLAATPKMACVAGIQGHQGTSDKSAAVAVSTIDMNSKGIADCPESVIKTVKMKDFDLNHAYVDMEECEEGLEKTAIPSCNGNDPTQRPSWLLQDSHQTSPPQTSGNTESTSSQSLSSSNGDAQCRTDRIIFKLFGKDPNDFPLVLRAQILDWLSHSPTDIESYIRPGCVILTIYLRLSESAWKELCFDLSSKMNSLLHNTMNDFWRTGWIYARIQDHIVFASNGELLLDIPCLTRHSNHHMIYSVSPVAVPHSTTITFTVKGLNLARPTSRLSCLFEGSYLVQETTQTLVDGDVMGRECNLSQSLSFSCSVPCAMGRGFIEVEDYGLSNVSFPFIVAEEDICSEVRMLEDAIDVFSCDNPRQETTDGEFSRNQALNFIHEFGWLLRRNHIRSANKRMNYFPSAYSLMRFRWLMSFAIDQEWAAVVKKLIDILFNGIVNLGEKSPAEVALSEDLLNRAVRRNSKTLVEVLLRYVPEQNIKETGPSKYLFRPDILGPSNLTPLHIAASSSGTESVVDALTDDPGLLGIKAWKTLRDEANCTPEDYARARGHDSYISLVQRKIDKQHGKSQVVINMLGNAVTKIDGSNAITLASLEMMSKNGTRMMHRPDCQRCNQQFVYQASAARTLLYRPAMLCMVGVAAVCVCVGLLLKTPPQVFYVFPSFRWELLHYGSM